VTSDAASQNRKQEARLARLLLRRCDRAALATTLDGAPYASLALLAADLDGSPILLLSDLARATRNLKADPRVSLLAASPESGRDPLDSPRLSLLGRVEAASDPRMRRRFLARHPQSARYADFQDFRFYRIAVERAHLIGGFGRVVWLEGPELVAAGAAQSFAGDEEGLIEHFNREEGTSLDMCLNRLARRGGSGWQVSGIAPDGIDARRADETARLDFPALAPNSEAVRTAFADLVAAAREKSTN
jgi:heme oxygenase (biliverdin-IX-beta and delta-forming)